MKKKKPRPYQTRTEHYDSEYDNSNVMTTREMAVLLRLHEITILKLFKEGKLPGMRMGYERGPIRFWRPNIMSFLEEGGINAY